MGGKQREMAGVECIERAAFSGGGGQNRCAHDDRLHAIMAMRRPDRTDRERDNAEPEWVSANRGRTERKTGCHFS